ncbi:hypothetical protein ACFQZ0_23670 [Streptomyces erythrogriseus]
MKRNAVHPIRPHAKAPSSACTTAALINSTLPKPAGARSRRATSRDTTPHRPK